MRLEETYVEVPCENQPKKIFASERGYCRRRNAAHRRSHHF
jgi:hypothetical protein